MLAIEKLYCPSTTARQKQKNTGETQRGNLVLKRLQLWKIPNDLITGGYLPKLQGKQTGEMIKARKKNNLSLFVQGFEKM